MRQISATISGFPERRVARVVSISRLSNTWTPDLQFVVRIQKHEDQRTFDGLIQGGLRNLSICTESLDIYDACATVPRILMHGSQLQEDDVVAVSNAQSRVHILQRKADEHHTIFLTNRCNSRCLMCSQPPTDHDDSWLVDEALDVLSHISEGPPIIGFTGGEPSLLGAALRRVLDHAAALYPSSRFEVLTNGRRLADDELCRKILQDLKSTTWMVPLYGSTSFVHDYVVQTPGAFEQTIAGILNLHQNQQPVQLRIVLLRTVLEQLPEICDFICRNLPFVRDVALMASEPVGYALASPGECAVDLTEWSGQLVHAVKALVRCDIPPTIMNAPLCALPPELWRYAHKSISDWKRCYTGPCQGCSVRAGCCGLFAWHERGWSPAPVRPFVEGITWVA